MLTHMEPNGAQPRNDSFDVITVHNPSEKPFEVWYNDELHAIINPHKAIHLVKLIAGDSNHGAVKHLVDRMMKLSKSPKNEESIRSQWVSKIVIGHRINGAPGIPTLVDQARQMNQELAQTPLDIPLPQTPAPSLAPAPSIAAPTPTLNPNWKFDPVTGAPIVPNAVPVITPNEVDLSRVEIQSAESTLPTVGGVAGAAPVIPPPHPDAATDEILNNIRNLGDGEDGRVVGEVPADDAPATPDQPNRTANPTKEDLINYARDVMMMNIEDPKTRLSLEAQSVDQLKDSLKYDIYA